ncbi:MAG: ABC transporter permease, partial [Fulvivirga sp.]|nr:ABC transporter permease [Fulvivirga sp.]
MMFKNYIKVIFRNLLQAPAYFIINLFGLSLGMAACLILLHYAYFESNYDQFHHQSASKYRVTVKDDGGIAATTPIPVHKLIQEDFQQIRNAVIVRKSDGLVKVEVNGKVKADHEEKVVMASEGFFEIFNFPIIAGNVQDLAKPNHAYITEQIALKYFATTDVLGKEFSVYDRSFG